VRDVQRVLTRIDVAPSAATIPATGAQQFTGHGFDQFGNEMLGLTFAWESTNTNTATIDQTGIATGINQGQATIRASAQGVTGGATLDVTAPIVVVNEVLADPPAGTDGDANHDGLRDAAQDEFVELVNATAAGINIAGWTVRTHSTTSSTESVRHTFAAGTKLPASESMVVFGGGAINAGDPLFGCAQVVKASSGGLSLTNTGLTILVRDSAGNLVTQLSYGGSTGPNGGNAQSLTRSPDITGNFVLHSTVSGANGRKHSAGVKLDGSPFGNCPGHPASITIAPSPASIIVGQTTHFTAQAFDQFGRSMAGVTITFASDNITTATVDSVSTDPGTGIATATVAGRNEGTAHITTQATDGTTMATSSQATLNVIPPQPIVSRIDVAPTPATINRGSTQQFTATAFDQNNQPVSGVFFTWTSSKGNVASITQNGLATGVGIGSATITASASDGASGTISGTATLNVQVPLVINEINADVGADNPATAAIEGDANRDGVRNAGDDEFVELINTSTAPVDISGVVIADATSNRFTIPANTILSSGRALVVFGGGSPPTNDPAFGGALVLALTGSATLSLNDGGDTVNVKLNVGGSDVIIASQTYAGAGNPAAPSDQSLTRSADVGVNNSGGNFVAHSTATNAAGRVFSPGTRADGTPFGSPAVTRIEVTPPSATINAGQTQVFAARAFSNAAGPEVEVQNVCFIWDSSDTSKATLAPATGVNTTASGSGAGSPTIRARAGGQLGTATLTVNVPPTLAVNDVSQNEGNSGTTIFHFVVSLSAPALAGGVSFDIATQDGSATVADNDYVARSLLSQSIPEGQSTYSFDVAVNGDVTVEPNETFFVNVSSVSGATVGDAQGAGIIQNDDSPTLSIHDVSASEGNGGTTTLTFIVTATLPAPAGGITFNIATADNTATVANNDYVARSLTNQTIPAGQTSYTFDVMVNGDLLVEPDEAFFVNVSTVAGAAIGDGQGVGTIQNDDSANLVISQVYGGGDNSGAPFRNDFVEVYNRGVTTVDFSITPYSIQYASVGSSFGTSKTNLTSGSLAPGRYFLVQESGGTTNGAPLPAPDATGTINLSSTAGKVALVAGTTFLATATCPGDDGVTPFNPSGAAIADFVGYGNSPTTAGHCYEGNGPAIAPSNTIADFRKAGGCVDTNDNASDFLGAPPNPRNSSAPVGDCKPDVTINDVTVSEGNSGTVNATLTVTLSAISANTVTVNYSTADGTATSPADYQSTSGLLTFNPGDLTKTIVVAVKGDTLDEPSETFFVNLSTATNAVLVDNQGQVTISENDPAPSLSINDISVAEGDSGTTTANFTVTLSAASGQMVTVSYATADNTALAGSDYQAASETLTFNPGQTAKSIPITINGDTTSEQNETFFVNLTTPTNATLADSQGQAMITNDDPAPPTPTFFINDVIIREGNAGTSIATFNVPRR
jgi:LEA14-like dessication related protein